ncbi:uncharacterized protein LOC113859467 [Abrus precatorius]|uniref:Uncharacterized protein LOC113859467 n=1 Tax=Abrus precatorius TaxID=3816 RepID=A0A8B8KVQ8_ABRPR|nr:uncharacterized protein LOC113859467 [Abrus precatorius]
MKRQFLEKFFPASRTAAIRKEISGIRHLQGESLYEYWERFNKLCSTCPNHQINEQLLIQYFYEGLMPVERSMIDAASGGALMDKTPTAARYLISNMAENSQQFSSRNLTTRVVHEASTSSIAAVDNQRLENKLTELTSLVRQLAIGQTVPQIHQTCGICAGDHYTDSCPQLQETAHPSHLVAGWRNHPNLRYGPPAPQQQQKYVYQQQPTHPSYHQPQHHPVQQQQPKQLATSVNNLQQQGSAALPSQPVVNPKGNVSAITLRSGKELTNCPVQASEGSGSEEGVRENLAQQQIPLPFPTRVLPPKKIEIDQELLDTFKKVEINIPLLDAIKQIPRYAKFLKELCTYKRNLKKRNVQTVSSLSQSSLPQKCGDPGTFSIPAQLESPLLLLANRSTTQPLGVLEDVLTILDDCETKIDVHTGTLSMEFGDDTVHFNIFDAMRHLAESHSMLSESFDFSVFLINVVDRNSDLDSDTVHVVDFDFDFDIVDVVDSDIDVAVDSDFDLSQFSDLDLDALPGCTCDSGICSICAEINTAISSTVLPSIAGADPDSVISMAAVALQSPLSVIQQQPGSLELSPLPNHLKYAYLDAEQQRFLVIISSSLLEDQEEKLLQVLKVHKKAIGWSLNDIPGISPAVCMHRIHLEYESRPVR